MIHGIGTDIVNIARFERAMKKWGARFKSRLFTDAELTYAEGKKRPALHLAARFAAKEALIKAYGRFVTYKKIEIQRDPEGAPKIEVEGESDLRFFVSISHEQEFAVAQVVIEK
ncbi:MAG: holo-ACP synthase [Deltaproteobacteria bacterium]|nr:holo-ACP synthase [Deltaproteobacteria bacterium]